MILESLLSFNYDKMNLPVILMQNNSSLLIQKLLIKTSLNVWIFFVSLMYVAIRCYLKISIAKCDYSYRSLLSKNRYIKLRYYIPKLSVMCQQKFCCK